MRLTSRSPAPALLMVNGFIGCPGEGCRIHRERGTAHQRPTCIYLGGGAGPGVDVVFAVTGLASTSAHTAPLREGTMRVAWCTVGIVVCASMLFAALPAAAQTATITGSIADSTGEGLPSAVIRVDDTSLRATSGASGGYRIEGVPAGTHTLRAVLIGYKPSSREVTVGAGDTLNVDFALS